MLHPGAAEAETAVNLLVVFRLNIVVAFLQDPPCVLLNANGAGKTTWGAVKVGPQYGILVTTNLAVNGASMQILQQCMKLRPGTV